MPLFRLQTLGSLSLHDHSGAAVPGHASQRRRLALLAVLAAAGDRGRNRDSLLTLLWPDASPERARHSLEQLLYAMRNSVNDELFLGVNPIALNPEVIRSDVGEFERALAENRLEDAVAEYRGPFLHGFVLPDALELEPWADGERARLAAAYARALESLASASERRSDFQSAAEWWEKRAAHDPYDSRVAQCFMRALDASGNRARAIQYAAQHERLLRRELGVQSAPAVSTLADRLRLERGAGPGTTARAPAFALTSAAPQEGAPPKGSSTGALVDPAPVLSPASPPLLPRADASPARRRRVLFLSVALIAAAVAAGLAWAFRPALPAHEPSIAVLPFLDMSPRGDNEYFSDGVTEEIITQLSAIPTLKVISRTSAMHYKKSTKPLRQIAAELGVANVLEGSVRREGDRIRITAQLIDAGKDQHLWSRSYDRNEVDVIRVQDEIAREVSEALAVQLERGSKALTRRGTRDALAYEYYRRGRYFWNFRTKEGHQRAIEYYQRAIGRDSGYADAYAGLADAYLTAYQFGMIGLPDAEVFSRIKWAADRALALDPQSTDAHTSAVIALWWQKDWLGAERELKRALELNPGNATARHWYALLLGGMGRVQEGVEQARRATELDPFDRTANANHALLSYAARDYDGAIALLLKTRELDEAWWGSYAILSLVYSQKGMHEQAIAAASKALALCGEQSAVCFARLAYALARAGRRAEAIQALQRAKVNPPEAYEIARAYVALGERDSAFAWLDRSSWKWPHRASRADPALDPVRSDPRFERLSDRIDREMGLR